METKTKAKQLFHRLPSRLKFGIMQYVVMNLFSGCAELCNLSTVLVGRMGGLGVGIKSAVKAHIVVLY